MEAVWTSDLSVDETRNILLKLGFVESREMKESLAGTY